MNSEADTDAGHDPPPESDQEPVALAEPATAPEPEAAALDGVRRCLDCESPLEGRYCSSCGQRDVERKVPLGELLEDLADEFTGLQARLGRTLRALVSRPGFLTNEYVEGRRVRYLAPSRLYLILALGFFFLVTSFDPLDEETSAETIASTEFAAKVAASGMTREVFTKKFLERENSSLPTILLIVMIPSLALMLKLLYLGSKINYVQHLVFAFHFFSIVLLSLTPGAATGWLPDTSAVLYYLGFIALGVWLLIAMRAVYRQSWLMTSIKFGVMSFAFLCLLAFCFWLAEVWALEGTG